MAMKVDLRNLSLWRCRSCLPIKNCLQWAASQFPERQLDIESVKLAAAYKS